MTRKIEYHNNGTKESDINQPIIINRHIGNNHICLTSMSVYVELVKT